jgi:hypothetical protein
MPAIGQQTRTGDPRVQATGQYRGTIDVTFDDGRIVGINYQAQDLADWNTKEAGASADAEEMLRRNDTQAYSSNEDTDVSDDPVGEATALDTLVGKLRYGYRLGPPEDSYRYTKKVDDWRIGKGHTWTDVKNQIQAVPEYNMTDEEWTDIMDRWNYLNVPARIQIMQDYNNLVQGDTWGEDFR